MNSIIEEIEKRILESNTEGLTFDNPDIDKDVKRSSLKEFLINFFIDYNRNNHTFFVKGMYTQTTLAKRRSIGDIFLICKHYYPDCRLHEVLYLLHKVLPSEIDLYTWHCCNIQKRVWFINKTNTRVGDESYKDEYGYKYRDYRKELDEKNFMGE